MIPKERRFVGYLPPLQARLVKNMSEQTGQSESSIIKEAVQDKFNNMPQHEREKLLGVKR